MLKHTIVNVLNNKDRVYVYGRGAKGEKWERITQQDCIIQMAIKLSMVPFISNCFSDADIMTCTILCYYVIQAIPNP